MAQILSRLETLTLPQVSLADVRATHASEKGSDSTHVDAPRVIRKGGGGGGDMDDVLKRLGSVESSVTEIKAHVSGLTATVQHLATKADVNDLRADVNSLTGTIPHLATRADVDSISKTIPHLATRADVDSISKTIPHLATKAAVDSISGMIPHLATKADLSSLETSIIKWIIGTVLTSAALAFAIAKFVI